MLAALALSIVLLPVVVTALLWFTVWAERRIVSDRTQSAGPRAA